MIIGYLKTENACQPPYSWCREEKSFCSKDNPLRICLRQKPGAYTLVLEVEKPEENAFAVIHQNGKEIGSFAVPYWGRIDDFARFRPIHAPFPESDKEKMKEIRERYPLVTNREECYCFPIPLILQREQEELEIQCLEATLNASMRIFNGSGFFVRKMTLYSGITPVPSSFERLRPGKSMVDLWGWMSMTSFEHPAEQVTSFAKQLRRGVLEAYKWGATNLEFLPVNKDGIALDLKSDGYIQSKDTTWNGTAVEELVCEAKRHGMLVEFFLYCLFGAEFVATRMQDHQKKDLFEEITAKYASVLEKGKNRLNTVDGIITEAWFPIDAPEYLKRAWRTAPNLFHLLSNNDGSQFEVHETGYTPATHAYSAHWPGFDTQHTGYDHAFPLIPYPKEFYTRGCGTLYTYMQGCGQTEHPRKKYPRLSDIPLGITNRTVCPDWILAQTHNFALRQLLDSTDHLAMAIGWEADEETMCPDSARRYVYAASQDPVRLAAACYLGDTGAGGEIDLKRTTRRLFPDDVTRLRPRHPYPATTLSLGNRFLQLLSLPQRDYTVLQYDMRNTGTFYGNGALLTLGLPFCITRFEDCRFLEKQQEIVESAGPMAVIREHSQMGSGYLSMEQIAEYTVFSDIPMVQILLTRKITPGNSGTVETVFGFQDYDHCEITEGLACIGDSQGLRPEILIFSQDIHPAVVTFTQGRGLSIARELNGAEEMRFCVLVRAGDFRYADADTLRQYISQFYCEEERAAEISVTNRTTQAGPFILRIHGAQDGPYYVRENGLWQHRGAVPSQQHTGTDLVKVYLQPGETGKICPFGDWNDVLRPGPGCANILAFSDFISTANGFQCHIHLSDTSPMLCSPSLLLCDENVSVYLNGKLHAYREGRQIFLPQTAGVYTLQVEQQPARLPQVISCFANVQQCFCSCTGDEVHLKVYLAQPEWAGNQAPSEYPIVIDANGWFHRETGESERRIYNCIIGENTWIFSKSRKQVVL